MRDIIKELEEYYEGNFDRLVKTLVRRAGSQEDAEDIVQETFMRAIAGVHTFRHDKMLEGWIVAILHNCLRDHMKRKNNHWMNMDNDEDVERIPEEPDESWAVASVKRILKRVKERDKARFLYLYYVLGLSLRDVTALTGFSNNKMYRMHKEFVDEYGCV